MVTGKYSLLDLLVVAVMIVLVKFGDFAQVRAEGRIDLATARAALGQLDVDDYGFDDLDRKILGCLIEHYGGGPVGLKALAATVGEDYGTIEDLYEPFLIQEGFLKRTPRGRVATRRAYAHLGYPPPAGLAPGLFD